MSRYKIQKYGDMMFEIDFPNAIVPMILDTENGNLFPINEANSHYQEYLLWVAEGNEAEEVLINDNI